MSLEPIMSGILNSVNQTTEVRKALTVHRDGPHRENSLPVFSNLTFPSSEALSNTTNNSR
jgi:hypothetical protein